MKTLSASAQRVQQALNAAGVNAAIIEYDEPARTSADAARVLGCTVGQIAKSLVFRGARTGTPILAIASGANRVDVGGLARHVGEDIEKPDAAFVRTVTGYAIGGIPPIGHASTMRTVLDEDLLVFDVVYAAGGTPHAMFPIPPAQLVQITGGDVIALKE